ncbi:alpha/beta hydrolase [Blastococcus saxobsidens]|uniref:Alpha/beta hydrolase n=1 Tax=Blastococcus saxobsidens TaxID=138336 RepID=A0A6L9VZS3_9ACTN|nr:alpha/beta hydrolase [Blastococcus saxobsidens]NEK85178.1 alpha/beta hydrolase [Blastococcus saxobsidens]
MDTTQYLERPEGRIAYEVAGEGPLVVCLPGMGDLRSAYRFTVPALFAAGHRVATVDLRGHGDSDATFTRYDDVAAGEDVLTLIENLGGPAIVVGNSMGAGAAVWAAAERPELVRGLALVGPFVRNPPIGALMRGLVRVLLARPWARPVWGLYYPSLSPGRKPDDFAAHRRAIADSMRRPGRTRAFAATTRTDHTPAEERLPQVRQPVLVVMGASDPDFADPAAEAQWIADRLRADVLLVPDAGHYPQADAPELVNPRLVDFCRSVVAGA